MAKMMIALQAVLLSILCLCMWEEASSTREMNQTISSECPSTCGRVLIPYPFGVGERCSRDKGFEIMCNYTRDEFGYNVFTPFLAVSRNELVDFLFEQTIMVEVPTMIRTGYMVFNFTHSPFTSSAEMNTLVGRGCDVFARITDLTNQKFVSGCVSICPTDVPTYELCSGIGCCQAPVPKGLKAFNVTLEPISAETQSSAFNSHGFSYAALDYYPESYNDNVTMPTTKLLLDWAIGNKTCKEAKKNLTSYACKDTNSDCSESPNGLGYVCKCHESYNGNAYLPNGCQYGPTTTLYLDWAIGNKTCKEAKKNLTSYACKDTNSYCDSKSTNGLGYVCKCHEGYKGNAYLPNGCQYVGDCNNCVDQAYCSQDIDEKFYCHCPSGWTGDGRKSGSGCTSTRIRYILIGIVVGMGLLALLAGGFFLLYKKLRKMEQTKTKQKFFKQNGGLLLEQQVSLGKANIEHTKIFVAEELEKATDNFNQNRVVGSGGFGTVYKGMLSDGRIVAIKKSKLVDKAQIEQFINELVILSHINHKNVVRLLGCCLETEVPLLAYEFIPNGTLSYHLHDEDKKSSLSWENRLRIANELASALSYLHSSTSTPIFHRDIKSCNILLDENYRAKASDFGISRSVPNERSHLTTIVQGTFGYLDPEYFRSSQFTDKSDVYSFGVVLVELLTGRKPVLVISSEEVQNTIMCFRSSMKENRVLEIIEPRVLNEGRQGELLTVAKLAKRCLKSVGKKRPTMKEVSTELEGLRKFHEQQCVAQTFEESENWLQDSSCISFSDLESEGTGKIACQERQHRGFRHAQSLSITRYHDLKSSINATT